MIKTCLLGLGRTGSVIAEQLLSSSEFNLVSVIAKPNSIKANRKLSDFIKSENALFIRDSKFLINEMQDKKFEVAIDFTTPEASLKNAHLLAEKGVNLVIGTTGFNKMQLFELKSLTHKHKIGLVYAPNISIGINLLLSIVKTLARIIPHYDVEITESHHRHKKDSPSGTAMKIASEISEIQGIKDRNKLTLGRKGTTAREPGEIGIHAIRAGGIVGVHQVLFAGDSDEIEITHRSYSRVVFAEGALTAAKFISQNKGFYNMEDILSHDSRSRKLPADSSNLHLKCN
jgi:4-hydroxy-tetrahydrodipicolinate reductase